jgi:hypothetical protein
MATAGYFDIGLAERSFRNRALGSLEQICVEGPFDKLPKTSRLRDRAALSTRSIAASQAHVDSYADLHASLT